MEGTLRILFSEPQPSPLHGSLSPRERATHAFLVGPENALVATVAEAILRHDVSLSPIVIHGPAGCGKSHFVQGLSASYSTRYPKASVVVARACELPGAYAGTHHLPANHDVPANNGAQNKQDTDDRPQADLLVIEDLDELQKKPTIQQRFLRIFDAVHQRQGLIVTTSRLPITQLSGLLPAVRSRLLAGLIVAIAPPALPTREALVCDFAAQLSVAISDEAARLLATEAADGASRLRAAVQTLAALPHRASRWIDVDDARGLLSQREPAPRIALRTVALKTARYFGVPLPEMQSSSRARSVVEARAVAMYLARQVTSQSLGQIGAYFGGRDHTTVLHSCRRTEELLANDAATQAAVAALRHELARSPKLRGSRQRPMRREKLVAPMLCPNP